MSDDLIPAPIIMITSVIGSIICLYCSGITFLGGIFSILAVILSSIYGTNMLRKIGKYSLGTGVPSIVYLLTAISTLSFFIAVIISMKFGMGMFLPILAIVIAALLSFAISLICKYIFKIQIEVLPKSFVSISIASVLMITSMTLFITKGINVQSIFDLTIKNGLILFFMIITVMIIQNPYNSCMGPNEDQYRTLSLSVSISSLAVVILAIISSINNPYWMVYFVLAVIVCSIFFKKYVSYTKHQAAMVKTHGLWVEGDGGE